ncbi:hypothetical protein FGB62_203g033 [Gracilaria domingensis]|nr:hypothetical protein FGB62_203g033 [Gracilaria domingensis]
MASTAEKTLAKASALEKAVRRYNDIDAMIELAQLLLLDRNFVSQRFRGFQLLKRAVKQAEDPYAMHCLARYMLNSDKDCPAGISLLERSLKLKERPDVLRDLGRCYLHGNGTAKNLLVATQMFERALRLDKDPYLKAHLAYSLLHTPDLKSEKKRAIALYREAVVESLDAKLMNGLGLLYHSGTCNLDPCPKKASKWYRRAIETSKFPSSMYNLAVLLLGNDPSDDDVKHAIRLLEDALENERAERTMLELADTYLEHGINVQRAIHLYETASFLFDSEGTKAVLLKMLLEGDEHLHSDHAHAHKFCWDIYEKTKNFVFLTTLAELLWSGTDHSVRDPKKAILHMCSGRWIRHGCLSLMVRHDLSAYPGGRESAKRFLKKLNGRIDRSNVRSIEAIMLSESEVDNDKLLALESFRSQAIQEYSEHSFVWAAVYLRLSSCGLPFDGHIDCITNPMKRFTCWKNVVMLNLASLLLELEGMEEEAVTILEEMRSSELRLMATLNLSYILMNDIRGVGKEYQRGMQLLEDAVKETNDASARTMLANALGERMDADNGNAEMAWKLWRSVEEEEDDEEELRKLRRLISASNEEKWRSAACDHEP